MPEPTNVFIALMPGRPTSSANQPRSFGREDYLTAAIATVLHADALTGGSLCREVFLALFDVRLEGPVTISVQQECGLSGKQTSYIDLHVTTPTQVVFLEHKTGARLGERVAADTQGKTGQLELYQAELAALTGVAEDERHLCMLTWAPTTAPIDARYWRGARYWWDLYTAMKDATASPDGFAQRLRHQLLDFFIHLQLAPPTPITETTVHDPSVVQRILALSLERACANGARFFDVRPASWGAYLVRTSPTQSDLASTSPSEWLDWTVGFWAGAPEIRCSKRGYLDPQIPAAFYQCDVDEQVSFLAEKVWPKVANAQGVVRQLPRMSKDTALARFGALRAEAAGLVSAAEGRAWKVYIGGREIVLSKQTSGTTWKVKLDSWNKGGANVRIESPSARSANVLAEKLKAGVVSRDGVGVRRGLVSFRLGSALPGTIQRLLEHVDEGTGVA